MFAWYVEEGLTLHAIARRLTAAGTPTATGRPGWGPTSVGGILRNTSYRGVAYGNRERRVPARRRYPLSGRAARPRGGVSSRARPADTWIAVAVPALVTPELFTAAQERLGRNRAWSPRNTHGELWWLVGSSGRLATGSPCVLIGVVEPAQDRDGTHRPSRFRPEDAYCRGGLRDPLLQALVWPHCVDVGGVLAEHAP